MRTLLVALICLCPAMGWAQDAPPIDPFETPPEEPAPIVDSAAVRAIRQSNPATPEQLFDAIQMLIRLDRTDLAKEYLQQLAGLPLDDAALGKLHERFGTADMIRLSTTSDLAPEGGELASRILQAAQKLAHDPQRITAHVNQLGSDQREDQLRAAAGLLRSGAFAVAPLVKAIAGSDDERLTKNSLYILGRLGDPSIDPLLAFLSSSDASLRGAAIQSLARSGSARVLPYLVRPYLAPDNGSGEQQVAAAAFRQRLGRLPSRDEALELLTAAARRSFKGQTDVGPDIDGNVVVWTWDEPNQAVVRNEMLQIDAAAVSASRLYRDLSWLEPEDNDLLVRRLITKLQVDQSLGGLDSPLRQGAGTAYELASRAGTGMVQQVLARSLETGHHAAAVGAAEVLAASADATVLSSTAGFSPLASALRHPNRRVRFAAVQAVVKLNPPGSFPGASRVPETLGFFAASTGRRGILVGHPSQQLGRTIGGLGSDLGFAPEAVDTAEQLLRRGQASPDWELIVISDDLQRTSTWRLIELLRADPRTTELPIVLTTAKGDEALFRLDKIADANQRVIAIREPIESDGVNTAIRRALELHGRDLVDRDRRMEQAMAAIGWMKQLSDSQSKMMADLARQQERLIEALYTGELSETAAGLLSRIGSTRAQLALADLASQNTMSIATRQAAADAFDQSIQTFGVLMTSDEIQRQYDRYNASRELSVETQRVLGALLDSIEKPHNQESVRS